jgi:hypothetical protein
MYNATKHACNCRYIIRSDLMYKRTPAICDTSTDVEAFRLFQEVSSAVWLLGLLLFPFRMHDFDYPAPTASFVALAVLCVSFDVSLVSKRGCIVPPRLLT